MTYQVRADSKDTKDSSCKIAEYYFNWMGNIALWQITCHKNKSQINEDRTTYFSYYIYEIGEINIEKNMENIKYKITSNNMLLKNWIKQ